MATKNTTKKKVKKSDSKNIRNISIAVILLFAIIGGFFIYRSYAGTATWVYAAERDTLRSLAYGPDCRSIIMSDRSGGKSNTSIFRAYCSSRSSNDSARNTDFAGVQTVRGWVAPNITDWLVGNKFRVCTTSRLVNVEERRGSTDYAVNLEVWQNNKNILRQKVAASGENYKIYCSDWKKINTTGELDIRAFMNRNPDFSNVNFASITLQMDY